MAPFTVVSTCAGEPYYTISNEGVRMLYVNPYDCKQPATPLSTWVIELDQPETVHSIQVSVVDGTINEEEGKISISSLHGFPTAALLRYKFMHCLIKLWIIISIEGPLPYDA